MKILTAMVLVAALSSPAMGAPVDQFLCSSDLDVIQMGQHVSTSRNRVYSAPRKFADWYEIPNVEVREVQISDSIEKSFFPWISYSKAIASWSYSYYVAEKFDPATHALLEARGLTGGCDGAGLEFYKPSGGSSSVTCASPSNEDPFSPVSDWQVLPISGGRSQVQSLSVGMHSKVKDARGEFASHCSYLGTME